MKLKFYSFLFAATLLSFTACDKTDRFGKEIEEEVEEEIVGTDYSQATSFEPVDMGTKNHWTTVNYLAKDSEDAGTYCSWSYSQPTYLIRVGDVTRQFRVASKAEWEELLNVCNAKGGYVKWGKVNETCGVFFKSSKNGNIIFLPAVGFKDQDELKGSNERLCYWSFDISDAGVVHFQPTLAIGLNAPKDTAPTFADFSMENAFLPIRLIEIAPAN